MFIDDTIESIVKEVDLGLESPWHEAMLDEWIMKTLKEITDDVNYDRLSKGMVAEMVSLMAKHEGDFRDIQTVALRPFLEKVIEELKGEQSATVYKAVHAIVTSYHAYKVAALDSFSQLLQLLVERLKQTMEESTTQDSENDLNTLEDAAEKLTSNALSRMKISDLAMHILRVFQDENTKLDSCHIVDNVIENAKSLVLSSDVTSLRRYARSMSAALETLLCLKKSDDKCPEPNPDFLRTVTDLVVSVLKIVGSGLESNGFTADDIQDMTKIFSTIVSRSISPKERLSKEKMLLLHISELLGTFESGQLSSQDLLHLGGSLIDCGNRLLQGKESFDSPTVTSKPSLTSSAVASDVLTHILYSIQDEMNKGLITKDAIKELALCILETRTSKDFYEKSSENMFDERFFSTPENKIEFAKETLKEMLSDFELGTMGSDTATSIALSVVSVLSESLCSEPDNSIERTAEQVIQLMQRDNVPKEDTKKIFSAVIHRYTLGCDEDIESIDSHMASCVVKEVLDKLERDITTSRLSGEDILFVVDDYQTEGIASIKGHCDIVNLTLAVLQQFLLDINTKRATKDFIQHFLSTALQMDIPSDESIPVLRIRVREIMKDIRKNRLQSPYIKKFVHAFSSQVFEKEDDMSKNKAIMLLQQAVQNVHPSIMTDFIRLTLQTLLSDCAYFQKEEKENEFQGHVLKSMSSMVANKVVDDLLYTIENAIREKNTSSSAERLPSEDHLLSRSDLSCIPSDHMNAIITETLNNIINSMKLESSLGTNEEQVVNTTSQIIHDFVMEKLQDIVESMQNKQEDVTKLEQNAEKQVSSSFIEDTEVKKVISGSFKSVIGDITTDTENIHSKYVGKSTSTVSLEAEAIVVGALHEIMKHYEDHGGTMSADDNVMKEHILCVLERFKEDLYTDRAVHDSLHYIFCSTLGPADNTLEDELIESVLDVIIDNVKVGSIQTADVYREGKVPDFKDNKRESSVQGPEGRPSLSLQKMTDMTRKMATLYDNLHPSGEGIEVGGSNHSINDRVASEVKVIATEVLEKTIDSVQHDRLSNEELQTLASAISDGDIPVQQLHYSDSTVEDMIVEVLKNAVEDLRMSGIDQEDLPVVTKKIFRVNTDNEGKETTEDRNFSNVSSAPSGLITEMVTTVLHKIATNLSEESVKFTKLHKSDECIQQSTSIHSELAGREADVKTHVNVNPNACKISSVQSLSDNVGPVKRTTNTPAVHSAHDIINKSTPQKFKKSRIKERSNGKIQSAGMSKSLTTSPKERALSRSQRPPIPTESKQLSKQMKSVKSVVTQNCIPEKEIKRNTSVIKGYQINEKVLSSGISVVEKDIMPTHKAATASDLPHQVYSLWGSFKLAVKKVKDTSKM